MSTDLAVDDDPRGHVSIQDVVAWLVETNTAIEIARVQGMSRIAIFRPGVAAEITHHDSPQEAMLKLGGLVLQHRHTTEEDDGNRLGERVPVG